MKWLYLLLLNVFALVISAQEITQEAVQDSLLNQIAIFPQEKIHLHTDRTMYVPGEKIWFKVYVVNAFTHQTPTYSKYVYIELMSATDSLIQRVMLQLDENELFYGHIFLADYLPEGDYTLRAYTRFMENLGDDYYFKKPIRINNINSETKPAKRQPADTYDVTFFPEGGYMLEGAKCKVAFKALKKNGTVESITGEIYDNNGNSISEAKTFYSGMGSFNILPEAGVTYTLKCKNQSGQEKQFKLPEAQKTYSLSVNNQNKRFFVEVLKSPDLPDKPLYLLIHCRGFVSYFTVWDYNAQSVLFSKDQFPSGILQIVLLDEQMNPLSERLIFNKIDDQANVTFSTDKPSYQKRESVTSKILVTDPEGQPIDGHISVAITDDNDIAPDSLHTILSSLLLSSELKGYIEAPGYYMQDKNSVSYVLDHLMMTHGWRRYDISAALKGNYQFPTTGFEEVKIISGFVRRYLLNRPAVNSEVILISNQGGFANLQTDSTGFFNFFVQYPDSIKFFVQAMNEKGKSNVELILDREAFPTLQHAPKSLSLTATVDDDADETIGFNKKAEQRAKYDDDMRLIQLPEVVVSVKPGIAKRDEARLAASPFNSSSDQTVYREDFEKTHPTRVIDILQRYASGIMVDGSGNVSIRGGGMPLVLVDGVSMDAMGGMSPFDMINVEDVESIDIFKGASAAIFGMLGGNGAISITTRRGSTDIPDRPRFNFATYEPLGFQAPVEFYSPKYDTPALKNLSYPDYRSTIYWKPDVFVSDDGTASFNFYTSDFPTTYSVVIEGITSDGRIIRQVETIEVK